MTKMLTLAAIGITLACLNPAQGAISVLRANDTVDGFTTSTPALDPLTAPGMGDDDAWGYSTDTANGQVKLGANTPEVLHLSGQAWGSTGGEDAPQFSTTLSGLDAGLAYNVYLYQAVNQETNRPWGLFAQLGAGASTLYINGDGVDIEISDLGNGSSHLERVLLGTVSGVTSVDLIINDQDGIAHDNGSDVRGFFKGVGVEVSTIPEPASLALIGLGGVLLLSRRRAA